MKGAVNNKFATVGGAVHRSNMKGALHLQRHDSHRATNFPLQYGCPAKKKSPTLQNPNLLLRQAIQTIHQCIYLCL
jgi:hypothetical protein